MEPALPGVSDATSIFVSRVPQVDSRDATTPDRWTSFLQVYEPFISNQLAQEHPQFARALRHLEHETRLEQERQSAQVLATLRLKDSRISALQKVVSEQREQLDVVLDELERRETKEDKETQVNDQRQQEDVSVQTESIKVDMLDKDTQTDEEEQKSGVLMLLEKLEKELKTVEEKNLALEKALQQRIPRSEKEDVKIQKDEKVENCFEILQRGVDAMSLSCGCVDNPLMFFVGVADREDKEKFATVPTCVNLEHRLEAQAVRLEHIQECLYLWRDAAVQVMKRQNEPDQVFAGSTVPSNSSPLIHREENEGFGDISCASALRSGLAQMRHKHFQNRSACYGDSLPVLKELANVLSKGRSGVKSAAKIVQKWAGWEAKHLEEVRALRQGFAEERAVALSRRTTLLKHIAQSKQRELDLQAEVNTLKKNLKYQEGKTTQLLTALEPSNKPNGFLLGEVKSDGILEYPQLILKLATAEQSLLAKDEQLAEANETIRALSSCVPTSMHAPSSTQVEEDTQDVGATADAVAKSVYPQSRESERASDSLRDQLASREQENLALVQSLCTIKEKCAQMEAIHQKELRVKDAEHAEGMENYMTTVNETLSRIESDKHRLEEENIKLRSKLQQLEEDIARFKLDQSQRSNKGTNTESDFRTIELAEERKTLATRVRDLELQLARERKFAEVVEQKKHLENQHEELHESQAKVEVLRVKQEYEMHCEALKDWRSKLQREFADYQAVQRASQQECDRRIEFLSACIEEYVRLADVTTSSVGKTVSTEELYKAVMEIAKEPLRTADPALTSSLRNKKQSKESLYASRVEKQRSSNQKESPSREDSWNSMPTNEDKVQNEAEISEMMWWKLRASKMEAYVRSAILQNDTFEDTIRQLELSMSNVKTELSSRLAHEAQLVANLAALKSELANTKEQAASVAEKYQLVSADLEKQQVEASSRGDEKLRARMAVQRKTELLTQQKAKVTSLQLELDQATKQLERLATAEKQAVLLQQKAKEHTQQLLHARQSYERCHDDNIQLSIHLEKIKERHSDVVVRLKAVRAENTHLRAKFTELSNSLKADTKETDVNGYGNVYHRSNQGEATSVASLTEETRALKRRVLQKQDVIVSYKAKVAECEAQLERQRETMVKLARTNRELQQSHRQRQQQELEHTSAIQEKLEVQLEEKQEQLDGLRASVYDSFEAFVFCQPTPLDQVQPLSSSHNTRSTGEASGDEGMFAIKRWTDFSSQDLEELKLAQQSRRTFEGGAFHERGEKRKKATKALREVENAFETTPEDCRPEICELLQCLCGL